MLATAQTPDEFMSIAEKLRQEGTLEAAIKECQAAAEQGNPTAQTNLGRCYRDGIGVKQNPKLTFQWYEKAAEQGHADAQANLGDCYERASGVVQNPILAFQWYEKAAKQGHLVGQNNLGCYYHRGFGVKQNLSVAFQWIEKAAEQRHATAQNNLGRCYEAGMGVEKNIKKAIHYYSLAAQQSHTGALNTLKRLSDEHPFAVYHLMIIEQKHDSFIQELKKSFGAWEVVREHGLQKIVSNEKLREFFSAVFLSGSMIDWVSQHPLRPQEPANIHAHLACAYFQSSINSQNDEDLEKANNHLAELGDFKNLEAEPAKNILYILDTIFAKSNEHADKMQALRQMTTLVQLNKDNLLDEHARVVSLWLEMTIDKAKYQVKAEPMTASPRDLNIIMAIIQDQAENAKLAPEQINLINTATGKLFITPKSNATENVLQLSRSSAPKNVATKEEKVTKHKRPHSLGRKG